MTSPRVPSWIAVPDRAAGAAWGGPDSGFDNWMLDEDLRAADRLVRELLIQRSGRQSAACPRGDVPDPSQQPAVRQRTARWPLLLSVLGLSAWTLLAAWTCCDGRETLRAGWLAALLQGQHAVLLGMLTWILLGGRGEVVQR